jgi:hypothetical protein
MSDAPAIFSPEIEAALSKPDTKAGRLQRACLERMFAHRDEDALPTSARFIYYELIQSGVVLKKDESADGKGQRPDQPVINALSDLRKRGVIPWEWIVDETRSLSVWRYASCVADYLADTVSMARIDAWGGQPPPMILTESRSLAGVLDGLSREYLAPISATNGQCGGHLHTEIAPWLLEARKIIDRPRVLYLGDHDFQGGQIEANTRRVLERIVGPLDWKRLAITPDQAKGLPVISKPDRRFKPVQYHDAVETEALGQSEIVRIVREHLDGLLPEPLEVVREREARQRQQVAAFLRRMGGEA